MRKIRGKSSFTFFLAVTSGLVIFTFFQLLRADITPLSAIDDVIAAGKQQLFSRTVSGALQAHQTFLAAKNQYDASADDQQKIKIHAYLALTRLADVILRNDGPGADTLRQLLAQYGVTFTGDAFDGIQSHLPVNAEDKPVLPTTAPAGDALRTYLAGDFLTALNASLADLDLVISLLGATESKEIIAKTLLDPQNQDPTLQDVEMDDGDYYLLRAALKGLKGVILTWSAYNQEFDVRELAALFNAEMFNIQNFLDRHPDLLKVRTGGPAALSEARQTLIGAIDDYLMASDKIRNDQDLQAGAAELFTIGNQEWQKEALARTRLLQVRASLAGAPQPVLQFVERHENWTFTIQQDTSTKTLTAQFLNDFTSGSYWSSDMTFGYSGALEYAVIRGTEITLRLASYSGWAEFSGTLDNGQITNGTYSAWNWTLGNFSGTFSATRTLAWDDPGKRFNPNPLFGNGTTSLNLRDLLPLFSTAGPGSPIAGTMGHGLSNDPTLGGILLDYDSQAIWRQNSPDLLPAGAYTIPERTIAVDGQPGDWDGAAPAVVDITGETNDPGLDIASLYLAKDANYLYFRIDLAGSSYGLGSPEYLILFRKQPGDQPPMGGDVRFSIRPQWQLLKSTFQQNGAWSSTVDLSAGNVTGSGATLEGRIPHTALGEIGGRFIEVTARPRSTAYSWLGTDQNRTALALAPSATLSGTLTVPDYSGTGPIYVEAYRYVSGYLPDNRNKLGGQVVYPGAYAAGMNYVVEGLPVGEKIFIFVHWDKDLNGLLTAGDYTNFYPSLTTVAGSNSLDLGASGAHSSFPPPEIVQASIFSRKQSSGATTIWFPTVVTGPGPTDVTVTVQGPGGTFTLSPDKYVFKQPPVYNVATKPSSLANGDYTFEAVDSFGRRATPVTYRYEYNGALPLVSTTTAAPATRSFVGTTTPTLSWQAPAGGSYFYQVKILDWSGLDIWYESEIQTATSFTVPSGILQPNTPYEWFVRVFDSAGHPMNATQTANLFFQTGTAQTPALGSVMMRTAPPAGSQTNYVTSVEAHDLTGVFPDEVTAIRLKNAAGTLLRSGTPSFTYRFFNDIYYRINYSSPAPPPTGDYTVEIDIKPFGQTTVQTLTATPVPYAYHTVEPVAVASLIPADNYYFDSPTPVFSWGPVNDPNSYYRLQIREPSNNWPLWNSAWTKNTTVSVPAGILNPGGSYLWRVWTASDLEPMTGKHNSRAMMNINGNATNLSFTINRSPVALKGDLNDDGRVDMLDAVLALQIVSGMHPGVLRTDFPISGADVGNNHKLGAEELIYILQSVAGTR